MIDFPASPAAGQLFFAGNGIVYQYSSTYTSWIAISSSAPQDGSFTAISSAGAQFAPSATATWETANPATVQVGNAGGWYNSTTGVFTPPAGRYFLWGLCSFNSTSSSVLGQMRWLKNGAIIGNQGDQNTAGTNLYGTVTDHAIVNANGTDTFECQIQCNVLFSNASGSIGAFAINQAVVPIGGGSSWRVVASTVPTAVAAIDFQNFPSDINHIKGTFDVIPSTNTHDFGIQYYDGSNTLLTTNYTWATTVGAHTQNGTAPVVAGSNGVAFTTMIPFDYPVANRVVGNVSGIRGEFQINNIRDATRLKSVTHQSNYVSDDTSVFLAATGGGHRTTALQLTGLRFAFQPSVNFTAGGLITLWGSP